MPNPTLPPQRYVSQRVIVTPLCIKHGKVMIQVNTTYKPGDRPQSIIRNSGGLFCVWIRVFVFYIFCCPPLLLQNHHARAAQRTIMQFFFAGTLLLLGLYAHLQAQKKTINSFSVLPTKAIKSAFFRCLRWWLKSLYLYLVYFFLR